MEAAFWFFLITKPLKMRENLEFRIAQTLEISRFYELGKRVRVPDDLVLEERTICSIPQIIVKKFGTNSV